MTKRRTCFAETATLVSAVFRAPYKFDVTCTLLHVTTDVITTSLLFIYLLYKSWAKSQNRNTNHMCTDKDDERQT